MRSQTAAFAASQGSGWMSLPWVQKEAAETETLPARPPKPNTDKDDLVSRGDAALANRDVTSARLFYQRAADDGDDRAALRVGQTFDPAFLDQAHLGRMLGDPKMAASWYRRARDLGNGDADLLLNYVELNR
jgi:TPR repeat protein